MYLLSSCNNPTTPTFEAITYRNEGAEITITGLAEEDTTDLTIPSAIQGKPVTAIANEAFKNSTLIRVSIPDSVKTIGDEAFNVVASLSEVHLGNGITSIGNRAFAGTTLTSLSIPDSLTTIGDEAFNVVASLSEVHLGNGITSIGNRAFAGTTLTSLSIPDSLTTIGDEAFNVVASLSEVHLGNGITSIGNRAFAGTTLTKLTILAPTAPSIAGTPAEAFPTPLTDISLNYPIGASGYSEAPWSDFGTLKHFLEPTVMENLNPEHLSIIISLKALPGVTITVEAHTEPGFTGNAAVTLESDPTATTAQEITLTGLSNETSYYLRARAYQDDQENPTDWIELPGNPHIPRPHPTVSIEGLEVSFTDLTISLQALIGVTITVTAHSQADYSDQAVASESLEASGEIQELSLRGLTSGDLYYIRVQGVNSQGETSAWTEAPGNPYTIPIARISDAIPRSGKITAMVGAITGTAAKVQVSENEDFSSIAKEISFTGGSAGSLNTLELNGLTNDSSYYLRILLSDSSTEYRYSTPLIPTADGKQYIHRLSELAKIGVDTENYPDSWDYELNRNLNFADANNDSVKDDPFDNDNDADNGNWTPITPGTFNDKNYLSGGYSRNFKGNKHSIEGMTIQTPLVTGVGLFGAVATGGEIKDLGMLKGAVSGKFVVGGLVGYNGGSITGSYTTGEMRGEERTGGIAGVNSGAIMNSYATGNVSGRSFLGGLSGLDFSTGTITNSYTTGDVLGESGPTGGLVGESGGTIMASYATGNVAGSTAGGLIGFGLATITNSYATGDVTGGSIGGLAGLVQANFTNCFRYKNQTMTTTSANPATAINNAGEEVGLEQLKTPDWYTTDLGWSTDTWRIDGLVNADVPSYPHVLQRGTTTTVPNQPFTPIP